MRTGEVMYIRVEMNPTWTRETRKAVEVSAMYAVAGLHRRFGHFEFDIAVLPRLSETESNVRLYIETRGRTK